tara:strand:- start:253 stop:699 length:447 start_codon:yes stop_codon:yes gene_type:complete
MRYKTSVIFFCLLISGFSNAEEKWDNFGQGAFRELSAQNGYSLEYSVVTTTTIKMFSAKTSDSANLYTSDGSSSPGGDGLGDIQSRTLEQWWWEDQMNRWVYSRTVEQSHDMGITWTTVSQTRANEGQPGYKPPPPSEEEPPSNDNEN